MVQLKMQTISCSEDSGTLKKAEGSFKMNTTLNPYQVWLQNGISPSQLAEWLSCQKKWYNNKVRRAKRVETAPALFGTALDGTLKRYISEPAITLEELNEEFLKLFTEDMELVNRMKDYSRQHGLDLVKLYVNTYPRESSPYELISVDIDEVLSVEGMDLPLHIIIDYLVRRKVDGKLWIADFKSSSLQASNIHSMYKLSYQMTAYMEAISQKMNEPVAGYIIDYIGTKKKVDRSSLARYEFPITKEQHEYRIKQFSNIVNEMAEKVKNNWDNPEVFYSNMGSSCTAFFSECPFMDACIYNDHTGFIDKRED